MSQVLETSKRLMGVQLGGRGGCFLLEQIPSCNIIHSLGCRLNHIFTLAVVEGQMLSDPKPQSESGSDGSVCMSLFAFCFSAVSKRYDDERQQGKQRTLSV